MEKFAVSQDQENWVIVVTQGLLSFATIVFIEDVSLSFAKGTLTVNRISDEVKVVLNESDWFYNSENDDFPVELSLSDLSDGEAEILIYKADRAEPVSVLIMTTGEDAKQE